jgi:ABC-type transporter Mla maintaining outer membrane lipid asymmetry ATPase subunit MlaF
MAKKELQVFVADQKILNKIYVLRDQKIMLDEDLADMYKVETRRLNEQVKRNTNRFPKDFMFTLTQK